MNTDVLNLNHTIQTPALDVIIETILLTSPDPLSIKKIQEVVSLDYDSLAIQEALEAIEKRWQERGLELINTASGYRFRTRLEMQIFVERAQASRPPRYSKSVLETLAVISYRQPLTRSEIENVRGVTVNNNAIKTLEARGWIETVGVKKDSPGQPQLWGTTKKFLTDLGLEKLSDLPPLSDIASALEATLQENVNENPQQNTLPILSN